MIKGLSDRRRLPRAGIIRLGIKKKHEKSGKEYPEETKHFVCPPLVQDIYGPRPTELIIMFPVESEQVFFQQFYKRYGNGILLCRGDGEEATYWDFDKGDFATKKCPCEALDNGKCGPVGVLQFLLPEVKEAVGVWQISTGSKNSIIDVNSGIEFVRGIAGRVAMIPLLLKREPLETHRIEGNSIKRGKHYTMKLSLAMSLVEIQRLGQIPPTQALIPKPDESQEAVDDLRPEHGFKPEDEEKQKKSEQEEVESEPEEQEEDKQAVLQEAKIKFSSVLARVDWELTKGEEEMNAKLQTPDIDETIEHYEKAAEYFLNKIEKRNPKGSAEIEKQGKLI